MKRIIPGSKMKEVDAYTIDQVGIPSLVLMERAAYTSFFYLHQWYEKNSQRPVLILVGGGNNGADGLAIARMFFLSGIQVHVLVLSEGKKSEQWLRQEDILKNLGFDSFYYNLKEVNLSAYDLMVDGIFGVGLSRQVEGRYAEAILAVNDAKKTYGTYLAAIDIPSGLDGDSGKVMGCVLDCDITFTMGVYKMGLLLHPGCQYCGKVVVCEIGLAPKAYDLWDETLYTYEEKDLDLLYKRSEDTNKGSYGKILILAGSETMFGAAYFSGMAAYLSGGGLVQIYTPKNNKEILVDKIPEAIVSTYEEDFAEKIKWASVIVVGPGLGKTKKAKELLEMVLDAKKPCVIDADGLNLLSEHRELMKKLGPFAILTPHLGEMARLQNTSIKEIKGNLLKSAKDFVKDTSVTLVLKDSRSLVITKNMIYINQSGNEGMATGGSGDVLSGILGTFYHCYKDPQIAAAMAVYVHGLCGDLGKKKYGSYSLMARHLLESLKNLLDDVRKN